MTYFAAAQLLTDAVEADKLCKIEASHAIIRFATDRYCGWSPAWSGTPHDTSAPGRTSPPPLRGPTRHPIIGKPGSRPTWLGTDDDADDAVRFTSHGPLALLFARPRRVTFWARLPILPAAPVLPIPLPWLP